MKFGLWDNSPLIFKSLTDSHLDKHSCESARKTPKTMMTHGSPDILKPNHHQPIFYYWALNQMQWSVQGVLVSGSAQATVKFWQAASKFRTLQICSSTNFARYSYTYMIRPSMAGVYRIYRSSTIFGSSKKKWYHNLKTLDSIMSNQSQSVLAFLAVTLHAYSRFVTLVIWMV